MGEEAKQHNADLGWAAGARDDETLGVALFLSRPGAAWLIDQAGISMTPAAFLLGILLSASGHRYQIELIARGIKNAATSFIESTLFRGASLLKNMGVAEDAVDTLVETLRAD